MPLWLLLCSLLLSALTLSSCTGGMKVYSRTTLDYFDTICTLTGYAASEDEFNAAADGVFAVLEECHKTFDLYHEYDDRNNVCTLNRLAGQPVTVTSLFEDLLCRSEELFIASNGAVDVTMGPVLALWHAARQDGTYVPDADSLIAASKYTGFYDAVYVEETTHAVTLAQGMSLDFGAVAKGYAADAAAAWLGEHGYTHYAVNLGGNIRTVGGKPQGNGDIAWTVSISEPTGFAVNETLPTLALQDAAVATSGVYERYYEVDGVRYHHIIDPDTLFPSDRYTAVTVTAPTAFIADALSTALFNMDQSDGEALLQKYNAAALWIYPDGAVVYSETLHEYIAQ